MINFKEINKDNWRRCSFLEVAQSQKDFVAPNWYSIIEATYDQSMTPLAIYHEDEMVGFLMYGKDPEDGAYWIVRLMIAERFQGKGYGKTALTKAIELLKQKPDISPYLVISTTPENSQAIRLYEGLGFKKTGEMIDGEAVLKLNME